MKQNFIKVIPKGENKPIILRAACKDFYVSQGAKVEEATEDEIKVAYPSEFSRLQEEKPATEKENEPANGSEDENEDNHENHDLSEETGKAKAGKDTNKADK